MAQGATVETYVPGRGGARRREYRLRDARSGAWPGCFLRARQARRSRRSRSCRRWLAPLPCVEASWRHSRRVAVVRHRPTSVVEMVDVLNLVRTVGVAVDFTMPDVADIKRAPLACRRIPRNADAAGRAPETRHRGSTCAVSCCSCSRQYSSRVRLRSSSRIRGRGSGRGRSAQARRRSCSCTVSAQRPSSGCRSPRPCGRCVAAGSSSLKPPDRGRAASALDGGRSIWRPILTHRTARPQPRPPSWTGGRRRRRAHPPR